MSQTTVHELVDYFQSLMPSELAEDWDNVGLLIGEREKRVDKIMTCLTVTPASVKEAVDAEVDLIVSHHPLPFRAIKRITDETVPGQLLLRLIGNGIALYSPHTAFDSAQEGINQQLSKCLELSNVRPLNESASRGPTLGAGRHGVLASSIPLSTFVNAVKTRLRLSHLRIVGEPDREVERVGIACGSGGDFLAVARDHGCDTFLTGEASFHTCLDAESTNMALVLTGHFASERLGVQWLADHLIAAFPSLDVWASRVETDPIQLA